MPVEKKDENTEPQIDIVLEDDKSSDAKPDTAASGDKSSGEPTVRAEEGHSEAGSKSAQNDGDDGELENYSESVKKRINKLTGKLREAERRERAAIDYAQSLKGDMEKASHQINGLTHANVTEFKNRIAAQELVIKQGMKHAIDSGDVDKQIEAQKALAALAIDQQRLIQMEARLPAKQEQRTQEQAQPRTVPKPPDAQPDAKAEAWASRNEWFGADEPMTLTAFSIHKKLVEQEGFDPTSDTYYKELDKRMRASFPHKFTPPTQTTVAPAARGQPGNQQPASKISVKLSPSQVAIAKKLGVPLEQYARQVAKLQTREGR